jgi:capsule polysaccharide export protein KpsE/RkpR
MENIQNKNFEQEPEDNRTFEEKLRDFSNKARPYFSSAWRARKKLILINSTVAVFTLIYLLFFTTPFYTSSVTILPEYGGKSTSLGGLSQLASLAGVKVGEGAPTEIYQNLITSESVLEPVMLSKYITNKSSTPINLYEYFELGEDGNYNRTDFLALYRNLSSSIQTNVDRFTKILTLTVTMPESQLSADVANEIIESLDTYIRTKRKSFSSEQLFYVEKRLRQVHDSLTAAEDKLKSFREQNRIVAQSPNLLLEQGRYMRNIEILQAVFIELNKQLEIAKIDNIRETPVVNLREPAKDPVLKAGPRRMKMLLTILFFSFLISIGYFIFNSRVKTVWVVMKNGKTAELPVETVKE